jgi:hypothetical protein
MMEFAPASDELLELARRVLVAAGFAVEVAVLPESGRSWLLAEDDFFAVGLISGSSLHELSIADSVGTAALLERLGGLAAGAKRWDAYLVLLTPAPEGAADSRERVDLLYNTRGLRRLLGLGVQATEESIRKVLTPFLPLAEPLESALGDIDRDLVEALVVNGIDSDAAARYVAAFRRTGSLEGV